MEQINIRLDDNISSLMTGEKVQLNDTAREILSDLIWREVAMLPENNEGIRKSNS